MSNYVDYNYYLNNYLQGREPVIPTASFGFYSMKATNEIRGRIYNTLILIDEDVKNCTCDLAEFFYREDVAEQSITKTSAKGISSESVGEYSVTYATSKSEEYSQTNRDVKISSILRTWLGNKNMLNNRRVDVVY